MTEAAAIMTERLKDERALIFRNLLNGVPVWQVARDFRKASEHEVMSIFNFILRKIRSRRLERMEPPIVGSTIEDVRKQRVACLSTLPKLNLDKEPRYKNVMHETVDLKTDGSIRHQEVLQQMKPLPDYKPALS